MFAPSPHLIIYFCIAFLLILLFPRLFHRVIPYLGIGAIVFLVVVSPVILEHFGKLLPLDVEYVSKIGGSYGAISAILSAIALCFLAVSSYLQVRQTQISQLHAIRTMQFELLRISLDNPQYRGALGASFGSKSDNDWRFHAYLNLWTMHFQMAFLTDAIDERGLRSWVINELFNSEYGLGYWEEARDAFKAEQKTGKHKTFFRIINQEYERIAKRSVLTHENQVLQLSLFR
jgi:hypothetical protein